jgi:hypothetical protein
MAAKRKGLLITLAVIACVVIAAAVAVRLVFTQEKLVAFVLPRVERMVDAKVTIGGVKVAFPFGFGVDIVELRFDKTLPDTTALDFSAETVTVRASLLSLLRRKPEITSAAVRGGSVVLVNGNADREIKIRGLEAHFSMKPAGELFALDAKARADSVLVARPGRPPAVALERVALDGGFETDHELSRLAIREARVRWDNLVSVKIAGEITDVKTAPRLDLSIEGDEKPLGPVLERIEAFKLEELSPAAAPAQKPAAEGPRPELAGGTIAFSGRVSGLAREPLGMSLSFEASLADASLRSGELASIGKIAARFTGSGNAFAWQSLMPSASKPLTLEQITLSWQAIELEGTIDVSDGELVLQAVQQPPGPREGEFAPPPVRISGLKARVEISNTDVKRVVGEFRIGGSPYTFNGSLANVLPASAELAHVAQKLLQSGESKPIADLGPYLDRMVNAPVIRLEAAGRSFDAQPYQKPRGGAKADASKAAAAERRPAAGGAEAVIFLKNTAFTVKLDSVVTREAVLTAVEAKGTIRDGRVRIDPASFGYAGGKGSATIASDVRKPARVESSIDFSLEGVEAGQALGRLIALGTIIQGKFNVSSKASLVTGQGLDPLVSLAATGIALSSRGSVNFEKYLGGLASIQNFDVSPLMKFDFNEWTGNFRVRDGRFITDDWTIASSAGAWAIKGSFGLDGSLDYMVHAVIPPAVQGRMKNIDAYKSALDLMRDSSGNLVLDIRVTGTSKHPSAMLDLSKAKSKAQDRVIEGLKKLIR